MAGLLVSVRTPHEARAAVEGGATVIDVKDPSRGPLGRASPGVWAEVRRVVRAGLPVSVALGELADWDDREIPPSAWSGLSYRKIGLARSGPDWAERWAALRRRHPGPPWVAVAYADHSEAGAPTPGAILDVALEVPDCVGVLVDTWDKSSPGRLDGAWLPFVSRARGAGRLVALAGRLDREAIARLAPLGPDLFAVRGAACAGGDRLAPIDPARVADLVRLAASVAPRISRDAS